MFMELPFQSFGQIPENGLPVSVNISLTTQLVQNAVEMLVAICSSRDRREQEVLHFAASPDVYSFGTSKPPQRNRTHKYQTITQ